MLSCSREFFFKVCNRKFIMYEVKDLFYRIEIHRKLLCLRRHSLSFKEPSYLIGSHSLKTLIKKKKT